MKKSMDKPNMLSRVGSIQQLAYVRPICYAEGLAKDMNAFLVKNGSLSFTVLADKCLDIAELSFHGVNIGFLAKPGLIGRSPVDTHGLEAQRSIMGGLLFTAGLENIGAPCIEDGKEYPMHGRLRSTPAEHLCADTKWKNGQYFLYVSGEMREAELFGENMTFRRKVETVYGESQITITDVITNEGFRPEPALLLYHFNFGYPFLDEETRIDLPSHETIPRDANAAIGINNWNTMSAPVDNAPEQVFLHKLTADALGFTEALIYNPALGLSIRLRYSKNHLPYFTQWKSIASGDYVVGLEPSNTCIHGRLYQKEHERDGLHILEPQQSETITIQILIEESISAYETI